MTKDALGDVIDWVELLKKNPPEKFLKRPPVRFLFDLFKFIGSKTGLFPAPIMQISWESIGDSKDGKIEFMEKVKNTFFKS